MVEALARTLAHLMSRALVKRGDPCCCIGRIESMPVRGWAFFEAANDDEGGPAAA